MKGIRLYVAVGLGALLLLGVLTRPDRAVERWLERRGAVRQELAQLRAENAQLLVGARLWQIEREAFVAARAQRDTVIRERIVRVQAVPVPEDCQPFTAPRDSVIADQREEIVQLTQLWSDERQHSAELMAGLEAVQPVIDSADAVLEDAPVRRTFWQALTPKPGIQLTAGVNPKGEPQLVAGVGLSWSF